MTKKNLIKKILLPLLMFLTAISMIMGIFTVNPVRSYAATGATSSSDRRLSDYDNGLQLLNGAGWYFDTDFTITFQNSCSLWLNGTIVDNSAGTQTMNILRYTNASGTNYRASFFVMYYNSTYNFGLYWVDPSTTQNPSYYTFKYLSYTYENVQYECPQSADDLLVTSDGYIYYNFTPKIGPNAGTTTAYYLSTDGFSETVPSSSTAVQFDVSSLGSTLPKILIWSNGLDSTATDLTTYAGKSSSSAQLVADFYTSQGYSVTNQAYSTQKLSDETTGIGELDNYDLIWIHLPTSTSINADVEDLKDFLANGGRLVMQGESSDWLADGNVGLSSLASDLGGGFTLENSDDSTYMPATLAGVSESKLVEGVTTIYPALVSSIVLTGDSPAVVVAKTSGTVNFNVIVEQAVEKGRITIMSDCGFYYNKNTPTVTLNDSGTLLKNLLSDAVNNKAIVAAGGNPNDSFGKLPVKVGDKYYASIAAAIEDAGSESVVIELTEDIALSETIEISSGKNIVIDLNGYAMTYTGSGEGSKAINNLGNLTVRDSSSAQSGSIYAANGTAIVNCGLDGGTLTIEGGTVKGDISAVNTAGLTSPALTMTGGEIVGGLTLDLGYVLVSGSTVIDDISVPASNISTSPIQVGGALSSTASVGVSKDSWAEGDVIACAATGYTLAESDASRFNVQNLPEELEATVQDGQVVLAASKITSFEDLKTAIAEAEDGDVINLGCDITMLEGLEIPSGKNIVINGNGYTLKRDSSYLDTLFTVDGGSLLLEDVVVDGGAIWSDDDPATRTNSGVISSGQLIEIYGEGTVTLGDGATLQNNHRSSSTPSVADRGSAVVVYGTGNLYMSEGATIKDCTVNDATSASNIVGDGAAVVVYNGAEVVISGTITGNYSPRMGGAIRVISSTADVTIQDAVITGNYTYDGGYGAICLGNDITVSGEIVIDGNYTATGASANVGTHNNASLIEDETNGLEEDSKISLYITESNNYGLGSVALENAEESDLAYFYTDGDVLGFTYNSQDGTVVVSSVIDSRSRLEYAIANAQDGDIIKLDGDIAGSITIPDGKNIVLDLNGYDIIASSGAAITNNGTLTVKDSVGGGVIEGPVGISNFDTLTVESGTVVGTSTDGICNNTTATNVTVTGGAIKGKQLAICDYASNGVGALSNCTLECTGTGSGSGIGYVLGSYGSSTGGTWTIGEGVVLQNNNNASQLINTDTETGIAGAGQVTVSNWADIKESMVAINGKIVVGTVAVVEINGVQEAFTSMEEALAEAAAASSATVKLYGDYEGELNIPANADIIIDLNGHDIVSGGTTITNYGTLTIVNSSEDPATVQGGNYCIQNYGELNIDGDDVSDITIYATGNNDAIGNQNGGTIHINGATIKSNGYYAILDQGNTTGNTVANAHLECGSDGSGGAFALGGYNGLGGEWTVSEGVTMKNGSTSDGNLINVSTLNNDTPVTIANGDEIALADADGDGTYTVVTAVAKVYFKDGTSKTYATLEDAIAACPEHEEATVEILSDITVNGTVTVSANQNITLTGEYAVYGNTDGGVMFKIEGGATFTVEDVTLNAQNKSGIIEAGGDVTVTGYAQLINGNSANGGAIYVSDGGSVTVEENATFKNNYASENGGAIYVEKGGTATVTGGTMTNNEAADCGDGIYLDDATLVLDAGEDGTQTSGLTDNIGMGGEDSLVKVTSQALEHKVYVEFADAEAQMANGSVFVSGDSLTPEQLKSSFRCANSGYSFSGTESENGLVIMESNEEYVLWFDENGTAHSYANINLALQEMAAAQEADTLGNDATLYFVQYENDANDTLNRAVIELTEAIVIPSGLTVNFDSVVKHTGTDDQNFTYEYIDDGISETVITRAQNYLGELISVENGATLGIENLVLDGGAVWGDDGEIEIVDDGKGTAGSVTNNNTGISASAPVIVNGGDLTLGDGATVQNNDNLYGQAGTGFGSQYYGGGIRNEGAGNLTMEEGSEITGCYAREGGAILNINKEGTEAYVEGGEPTVTINGGTIEGNASQMKGAAIQTIYGGAETVINGGTIIDNFSLNDLGTLAVEEGGSLTVNGGTVAVGSGTVLGETEETENENAIYVYNKYSQEDYSGATNTPFIEGDGAAEIIVSGSPEITGYIFLDDPCVVVNTNTVYAPVINASDYEGNENIEIALEDSREFGGAIVIVGDGSEDKIVINYPEIDEDEYDYVVQTTVVDENGNVSYVGYALNIEQTEAGKITITGVCNSDAEKLVLTIGGNTVEVEVVNGKIECSVDLNSYEGNDFDITKIESVNANGSTALLDSSNGGEAINIGVVKFDGATGNISVPENAEYVNKDGELADLTNGIIPNDIAIDENGYAAFNVNGEEVVICVGVREEAPVVSDGALDNFDIGSTSVTVNSEAGLEYAVVDGDGNIVQGWIKAEEDGTITFDALTEGTNYSVIVRTPANENNGTIPSEYKEVVEFTTLTEEEAGKKSAFEDAVNELNADPTLDNALAVLEKYDELSDEVKALGGIDSAAASVLAIAKSELKTAILNSVGAAKEGSSDGVEGILDGIYANYAAEIDGLTDPENADEIIALIKAKAEAEIAIVERYDELLSTNADTVTARQEIEDALTGAIETFREVDDIDGVETAKNEAIKEVEIVINTAAAIEKLEDYKDSDIFAVLESQFGVTSTTQKDAVNSAYGEIVEEMKEAVANGNDAEQALEDAKTALYAAATMAGLRELASGIENEEVKAEIESEIAKIAENTSKEDVDSASDAVTLAILKQLAKEELNKIAENYPSSANDTVVADYEGLIDDATSEEEISLLVSKAEAVLYAEVARDKAISNASASGADETQDTQIFADINKIIDEAIAAIENANDGGELLDTAELAESAANAVVDSYNEELLKASFSGIIGKDIADVTSDDLDEIDAALEMIEGFPVDSQDGELISQYRDELLEKKEAAILYALEALKSKNSTVEGVSDIVDAYIEELDSVNADGGTAADKLASEALNDILANAKNEVAMQIAREQAKAEIASCADSANDSDEVKQIIEAALENIGNVLFDENKTEDENKAAIEEARNAAVVAINDARAKQYSDMLNEYLGSDADVSNVKAEADNGIAAIEQAISAANGANELLGVNTLQTILQSAELEMDKERAKNAVEDAAGSDPSAAVQAVVSDYNAAVDGIIDTQTTKEEVELERDRALALIAIEAIREEVTANIDPDYGDEDKLGAKSDVDAAIDAELSKIAGAVNKAELDKIVEDALTAAETALADYDYNKITKLHSEIIGKSEVTLDDLAAIDAALEDIAALKDETKEKAYFETLRNELLEKKKDAIVAGLEAQKDGTENVEATVDGYIARIEAILTSGDAKADEIASNALDALMAKANGGIDFEKYKNEKIEELATLVQSGDTSYAEAVVKAEQEKIEALTYDENAALESQINEVDAIVDGVPAKLELQRFKDSAVAEYKECYEAITGSALADDSEIYGKLNAETTKTAVNEKLANEVKALVVSLERYKDSSTTKGYIDAVLDAIDGAISAANGNEADLSAELKVSVGNTSTDIKTAVEGQRSNEKASAKKSVLDYVISVFGANYAEIQDAADIVNSANSAINKGDYADYAAIVANAKDTVNLLKGVEDYKQELESKIDSISGLEDSQRVKELIAEAKDAVGAVAFNKDNTLAENEAAIDEVYNAYVESVYAQRIQDYKDAVDLLVGISDGSNVIDAANEAKAKMDSLSYPTEEDIRSILEEAKANIVVERFKDEFAGENDVLRKEFDSITADDVAAIEKAIEAYTALDEETKAYVDSTAKAPYTSYADELKDKLARAEFERAKAEAIANVEAALGANGGDLAQSVNKSEIDKIVDMTYDPTADGDRDAYVKELLEAVAEAEKLGVIATEHAQNQEGALNGAAEELEVKKESGQYNDEQKRALENILSEFENKVNSLPAATSDEAHEENEELINAWLEEVKQALGDVPVTSVTNGDIDLEDQSGAEYGEVNDGDEAAVWGVITNDSSMPGGVQLIITQLDEEKAETVKDAVGKNTLVVAEGSNLSQEELKDLVEGKNVAMALDIYLLKDNVKITEFEGVYTVKILLTAESRNMNGAQVIHINDDGGIEVFETWIEDGKYLVFTTTHFSEFYILETANTNLWWLIITLSVILLIEAFAIAIVAERRKETEKNEVKTYSVFPFAALAVMIVPSNGIWISAVLGVLVVAAAIVLAVMLVKKPKNKKDSEK